MPRVRFTALFLITALTYGCQPAADTSTAPESDGSSSPWVREGASSHLTLTKEELDAFADVISAAQQSARKAQLQFNNEIPADQTRYAVLWMAATVDGSREFVWVRPVSWSLFRVEGVLVSQPTQTLECGRSAGEFVSFAVEDLADWVVLDPRQRGHALEGASTLDAIEQRIGAPRP